jgi:hypothetical protein
LRVFRTAKVKAAPSLTIDAGCHCCDWHHAKSKAFTRHDGSFIAGLAQPRTLFHTRQQEPGSEWQLAILSFYNTFLILRGIIAQANFARKCSFRAYSSPPGRANPAHGVKADTGQHPTEALLCAQCY